MMAHLKCFLCTQFFKKFDEWTYHLKFHHALYLSQTLPNGYPCPIEGCARNFTFFQPLSKHIRDKHGTVIFPRSLNTATIVEDNDCSASVDDVDNHSPPIHHADEQFAPPCAENKNSFSLHLAVVKMVAKLQSKANMNTASICYILDVLEEIFSDTVEFLKHQVQNFIQHNAIAIDSPDVVELIQKFDFGKPFADLKTLDGQIRAVRNFGSYIEPKEIPLGQRIDQVLDRKSQEYVPRAVYETFQYVSVIEVLKVVMANQEIRTAIESEKPAEDGVLSSFIDGKTFKNSQFFQKFPHALRLQLYYDELEITNPLASKRGVHKLGAFYYIIQNLPDNMRSQLNSIHVLCLCYYEDVKKYGFQKVLDPFLSELKLLESDNGVRVNLNGEDLTIRASIAAFCGDGAAVHDVYGMLSPSANKFCRLCLIRRQDLLNHDITPKQERTEEIFKNHVAQIMQIIQNGGNQNDFMTQTGVRNDSPLNKSKFFHIANNKVFDPMHDILCGIAPMILKLVVKYFVYEAHLFTLDHLNAMISSFHYGILEIKNKPSANFIESTIRYSKDHALSQRAMQMWCLVRAFPFLVCDRVPENDKYLKLIHLLLRVMEIVFAPRLTTSILPYLNELITDLFDVFHNLFPNVSAINKFHHLTHYPVCMQWSGPMVHLWCMRFEGKHGSLKKRAQVVNNFKNSPKTLLRVCQFTQSAYWGSGTVDLNRTKIESGETKKIFSTLSHMQLNLLGYSSNDDIFVTKSVKINGILFRVGLYLVTDPYAENELPVFGRIREIIVLDRLNVYFYVTYCSTTCFDPFFNAYVVEDDDDSDSALISIQELKFRVVLDTWMAQGRKEKFISLRYILF
ncbi:uncharacterized protein LOC135834551 [Planococcus citri]|uniref:uncharacterized protein LOC135834551 n=1 Tax=Planococcus citri TaxID=170843 RepID=UPI0031F7D5B7